MKRMLGVMLVVAFAIGALGGPALGAKAPKVDVCHWPGHTIAVDGLVLPDVFVSGPPGDPYPEDIQAFLALICDELGGNVISVSANGAINGHGAVDVFDL